MRGSEDFKQPNTQGHPANIDLRFLDKSVADIKSETSELAKIIYGTLETKGIVSLMGIVTARFETMEQTATKCRFDIDKIKDELESLRADKHKMVGVVMAISTVATVLAAVISWLVHSGRLTF